MPLWSTPLWRPSYVFSTGFLWDTSLKLNWSAHWCIRCVQQMHTMSRNKLIHIQVINQYCLLTSLSTVFSSWMCPCFAMWRWSASQRLLAWVSASMRNSLSHSSLWPCVNSNRCVKMSEKTKLRSPCLVIKILSRVSLLLDAASEHQHKTGLLQRERWWAELHPEPQSVPLYFP